MKNQRSHNLKERKLLAIRIISKRSLLLFATLVLLSGVGASAQIPANKIYDLGKTGNNFFDATHYAKQIITLQDFFSVNILPNKEVTDYGLAYALISLDTADGNGFLKVALLRDTVSKKGKLAFEKLKINPPIFYPPGKPLFSKEFVISGDSIFHDYSFDPYFPSQPDLKSQWVFGEQGNSKYLALIGERESKSIYRKDTITNEYLWGYEYNFHQNFFMPYTRPDIPYHDLRFTFEKEDIPVYEAPKKKVAIKSHFGKGEYIAVRKDSANWLQVDRILVVADTKRYFSTHAGTVEGTTKLNIIHGWIKKEDLVSNPWVKQKQQTKDFRLEVSGTGIYEENGFHEYGGIEAIKVINKKSGQIQLILDIGAILMRPIEQTIELPDANFDGHPDIMIDFQTGGAGPNNSKNFYIYNPKYQQFEFNEELSALPQVEIDEKNKKIISQWRNGAANHGGETYTFQNGKQVMIASWDQSCGYGFFCKELHGQLINGKWVEKKLRSGPLYTDNVPVFSSPDEKNQPIARLKTDDWILVKEETPLWLGIEATYSKYKNLQGWVTKQSLIRETWTKRSAETPLFRFEIADSNMVIAIKVVEKASGKPIQIILTENSPDPADSLFQTADYDGDGLDDFRVQTYKSEEKTLYDYYLFHQIENSFVLDPMRSKSP